MMTMGLVAFFGGAAFSHRSGRDATLPALTFIGSVFVTGELQVAVVFVFE
jgi:hypothetical protein